MPVFSEVSEWAKRRKDVGLDMHGQPLVRAYNAHAVGERQVDELIGLVKGVLADGEVQQSEAEFLLRWMEANRGVLDTWPARVLYPRIQAALVDGHMDAQEESELLALLLQTVGGNTAVLQGVAGSDSTALPLTKPAPDLVFSERSFCFTGKFYAGTRDWCMQQVIERGGRGASGVTKTLHYLVIGELGSADWRHSTHGRKIETAVRYAEGGTPLAIVSEQHWVGQLT